MTHDEGHLNDPERMQPEEEDRVESGAEPTDPTYPSPDAGSARPGAGPISEHLAERGGDDTDLIENVPAGGAGADAGAGQAARVDPSSDASVPDESEHNDEPGIGTRGAED